MNSLKKGEGVPLLNFVESPEVPILNVGVGPGVPLLNFRGCPGSQGPGPTFTRCLTGQLILPVCLDFASLPSASAEESFFSVEKNVTFYDHLLKSTDV